MTAVRIALTGVGILESVLGAAILIALLRSYFSDMRASRQLEDVRMILASLLGGVARLMVGAWLIVGGVLKDGLSTARILGLAAVLMFTTGLVLSGLYSFDRRRWEKSSGRGT